MIKRKTLINIRRKKLSRINRKSKENSQRDIIGKKEDVVNNITI
jgi:hypothetical protein